MDDIIPSGTQGTTTPVVLERIVPDCIQRQGGEETTREEDIVTATPDDSLMNHTIEWNESIGVFGLNEPIEPIESTGGFYTFPKIGTISRNG